MRCKDKELGEKEKTMSCDQAKADMTAGAMAELISKAPPGPWPHDWAKWDCTRDAHIFLMEEFIASQRHRPMPEFAADRGIVVSVNAKPGYSSGKDLPQGYMPGAWVLLKELRRTGCTLPVTFAYLGDLEWDPTLTRLVRDLGVTCIDLRRIEAEDPYRPRILNGWESKTYAIIHAPYRECLYLDADNIPMADPTFLFDSQQFKYHGSVFWPDVPPYDRAEWLPPVVWRNIGMTYRDEVDFESGQFMINKATCWKELLLTQWINEHSDYFYKFVFGDKSTFHLAWAKLGTNWSIPKHRAGGNQASLFQHDFSGNILFQHCTRNKPGLGGYPSPGSLLRERECKQHLDDLKTLWNGRLWSVDNQSQQEKDWQSDLEGKLFTYAREGIDERPMRLLQDGRIGRGLERLEVSWAVFEDGGSPLLVISAMNGCPTVTMRLGKDGVWRGRWLEHERCWTSLIPAEA